MSKVFIEDTTLTSIGNAIRTKNNSSELISPLDMADMITNLPSGGELTWTKITGTQSDYVITFDLSPYVEDATKSTWMLFVRGTYNEATTSNLMPDDMYTFSPLLSATAGAAMTRKSRGSISGGLNVLTGYTSDSVFGAIATGNVSYTIENNILTITGKSNYQIGPKGVLIYIN